MNNNYSIGSGSIGGSTFYPEDEQPITSKSVKESTQPAPQSVPDFVYDPSTSVPEFLNYDTSQSPLQDSSINSIKETEVVQMNNQVKKIETVETKQESTGQQLNVPEYVSTQENTYIENLPQTETYVEAQSYLEPIENNVSYNPVNTSVMLTQTQENQYSNSAPIVSQEKQSINFVRLISNVGIVFVILILIISLLSVIFFAYPQYIEKRKLKIARSEISSFEEEYTDIRQSVARLYQATEAEYALDINSDTKALFSSSSNFYWDQINNLSESLIIKLDQFTSDFNYFKDNYNDLDIDNFNQRLLVIENNIRANYDFVALQRSLSRDMLGSFKKLNLFSIEMKDKNLTEQVVRIRTLKTDLLKSKIDINSELNKYTFLEHKEINNHLENVYDFWIKKCDDMVNALISQNIDLYNTILKSIEVKHDEDFRIQSNRIYFARLNDYLNKDDNNESLEIIFDKINTKYNNNFIPEFLL